MRHCVAAVGGALLAILSLAGCIEFRVGSPTVLGFGGDPGDPGFGPDASTSTISAASTYVFAGSPMTFTTAPETVSWVNVTGGPRNYEVLFGPFAGMTDEGEGRLEEADDATSTEQGPGAFWVVLDGWAWLIGWYPIVHGQVIVAGSDGTSLMMLVDRSGVGLDRAILYEGGPAEVWKLTDHARAHVVTLNPGQFIDVAHNFTGNLTQSMVQNLPWPLAVGEVAPAGESVARAELREFITETFEEAALRHKRVPVKP